MRLSHCRGGRRIKVFQPCCAATDGVEIERSAQCQTRIVNPSHHSTHTHPWMAQQRGVGVVEGLRHSHTHAPLFGEVFFVLRVALTRRTHKTTTASEKEEENSCHRTKESKVPPRVLFRSDQQRGETRLCSAYHLLDITAALRFLLCSLPIILWKGENKSPEVLSTKDDASERATRRCRCATTRVRSCR